MKTELKSLQSVYSKLEKKYNSKPHQSLGTVLNQLELTIRELKKLDK